MLGGKEMPARRNFLLSSAPLGPVWQALHIGHLEVAGCVFFCFVFVFLFFQTKNNFWAALLFLIHFYLFNDQDVIIWFDFSFVEIVITNIDMVVPICQALFWTQVSSANSTNPHKKPVWGRHYCYLQFTNEKIEAKSVFRITARKWMNGVTNPGCQLQNPGSGPCLSLEAQPCYTSSVCGRISLTACYDQRDFFLMWYIVLLWVAQFLLSFA